MLQLEIHVCSPVPLREGLQSAARRSHAGVVHAPGRTVHGRVPGRSQKTFLDRNLQETRTRGRGDDYGRGSAWRGCRHHLCGFAAAPGSDGPALSLRSGRRTGDRKTGSRCAGCGTAPHRPRRRLGLCFRGNCAGLQTFRRQAPDDRLLWRSFYFGQLYDRRRRFA